MKYLSKLLSMLLVGAMLYSTGCTDYQNDIDNLNEKVDQIQKELQEGQIDPLKADVKALQEALEAAIEDAEAKIAENKAAIDALKAVDAQHDAAIAEAKAAIAEAMENIADLQGQLNSLSDKHDTDIAAVYAKINEEVAKVNDAITEAVERISDNEEAIEDLKDMDAELAEDIEANLAAILVNAAAIEENAKAIQENADAIEDNAAAIAENVEAISGLQTDLADLTTSFETYKAATDAAIATLESRMETAEAAIVTLNGSVEELYQLHDNQNLLIENLEGNLETFMEYTQTEFDALKSADEALNQLIVNLENSFIDYQKIVNAQFEKAFGDIAKNTELINALSAKHDEEVASLVAQDAAILETLDQHVAWMVELEENLSALDLRVGALEGVVGKIQTNIAAMQTTIDSLTQDLIDLENTLIDFQKQVNTQIERIDAAIVDALAQAKAYADEQAATAKEEAIDFAKAYTDALQRAIEKEIGDIRTSIDQLSAYATSIETKVDEYIENTDAILAGLRADLDKVINRVQSIVFVPEYSDGKGTINYAKAGDTLVEARSTMVYQVYPAECAALIANAPAIEGTVAPLTYDLEGLKTRGGLDMAPQFNIVGVEGDLDGRLYVTFDARHLGADFYAGKMEYAASLVLAYETAKLSTVYTNVVPAKEAQQIGMAIMYGEEKISGCYNPTENGGAYKFEYTDTETVEQVLPEHRVVFDVDGTSYEGIEALNAAGYALTLERTDYLERLANEHLGTLPFEVKDVDNDGILDVKVVEVSGTLIWQPLYAGYTYTAGTLKAEAYSNFVTVPVQAAINFESVSATWTYSKDAAIDAANNGAYSRGFDLTVANHNLPSDVDSVAVALANGANSTIVTLDGEQVDVNATIHIKGDKMLLELQNFAWDKNYEVVAMYDVYDELTGQAIVEVTVTIPVTTIDRNREPIVINLDPSVDKFEANLQLTNQISDNLDVVYETLVFGNENYDITCDEWLAGNFVVNYTYTDAVIADGEEVVLPEEYNTLLAIDGVNAGKNVYTAFCYADFDFVPAQVEYTKTVTTWYGQEIVLNKVLNFEFPVYDFKHNSIYVYGADNDFYSQVQPEYTWKNDNESEGLLAFDVAAVDLRAAFSVVDAEGKKLTAEQMAALSLSFNFKIEDEDHDHDGISIDPATDKLSYYGANPYVNVRGNIYITNDNGSQYVVPTSFDKGGKYETYNVVKFNPIGTAEVTKNPTIDVNNAIAYNVHVLDYVKLMDHRMGGRQNYDLITDGAWVEGNGENGFAQGVDVRANYMYRINEVWVNDTSDVDEDIRPYITLNNGTLTFDNSQQLELTAPFTIPVTLKFQNCWMEKPQQVTVKVTFNPIK